MIRLFSILVLSIVMLASCTSDNTKTTDTPTTTPVKKNKIATPNFDENRAFDLVKKQVDFGTRVPNTAPHDSCAAFLAAELEKSGADVIVQKADVRAYDGTILKAKNIIGQFDKENSNRILLFAHWDTRPFADYDKDEAMRDTPIDGANDGASGVAVLLEIARSLGKTQPNIGVDIILFDAEDYGIPDHKDIEHKPDTWCLGSQYWSNNPHVEGYSAKYGILLDMVGGRDAIFTQEGTSREFAPHVLKIVWEAAHRLGYSEYFPYKNTIPLTDDHLYVNKIAGIPSIDIIHHDPTSETTFGKFWHTHDDNMQIIDKKTLKAVGQTVLEVIYQDQ